MKTYILEDDDFGSKIYWYCKKCEHKNNACESDFNFDDVEMICDKCKTTHIYKSDIL